MKEINLLWWVFLAGFVYVSDANILSESKTNILMVMALGSKSHFTLFDQMSFALGEKGHKVTLIAVYPVSKAHPNVEAYSLGLPDALFDKELQTKMFLEKDSNPVKQFTKFSKEIASSCNKMYEHAKVKAILEEIKTKGKIYDLAMVNGFMNECTLPFASIAAKHVMYLLSIPVPYWIAYNFNIPSPLAITPDIMSGAWPPMSFLQRFGNTLGATMFKLFQQYYLIPIMQASSDKYLPEGAPSINEAMKKVCFILANGDDVFTVSQPSMPFVDNIGGFHLREPKPLPKELAEFVDSSGEHGIIVFTLGSFVQAKFLPDHVREAFISAFSKLKQKVLWKFEEKYDGMPENVKIVNWMPQQDVLGHPKARLFIIHGGRFSLQEATYHGVPIIGLPLFGDHEFNLGIVKRNGFGDYLDILNITSEAVYNLLNKVLNDKSYAENAKKMSSLLKDKMTHPLDRGVYWVEYIIRHNGAPHLKNRGAEELNIFQYFLLDVFAVLAIILGLGIVILFSVIRFVFRFFTKKQKTATKEKKIK